MSKTQFIKDNCHTHTLHELAKCTGLKVESVSVILSQNNIRAKGAFRFKSDISSRDINLGKVFRIDDWKDDRLFI